MVAHAKKIPPPKEEGFWSERPGSNRPPRPWQGRALPNELLSHIFCQTLYPAIERTKGFVRFNFSGSGVAKIGQKPFLKKY